MKKTWIVGDPIPSFTVRTTNNPQFQFDCVAGRYVVLSFFGSASIEKNRDALKYILSMRDFFDDKQALFFGLTIDPSDEATGRLRPITPGFRFLWDDDKKISQMFGAISDDSGSKVTYLPFTLVLDSNLRVLANIPINDANEHNQNLAKIIDELRNKTVDFPAPILLLPRIFEPTFCAKIVDYYKKNMPLAHNQTQAKNGDLLLDKTTENEQIYRAIQHKLVTRLLPEVKKVFHFSATKIERYCINCNVAENSSMMRYNRHNNSDATNHRKFMVLVNWNDEFEGAGVCFPEYSTNSHDIPIGGALVASSSLITEILPVKNGIQYSSIIFIYD